MQVLRETQGEFTSVVLLSFWETRTALDAFAELDAQLAEWGRLAVADQPEVHLRPNKLVTYKHVAAIMASAQRQQFMN